MFSFVCSLRGFSKPSSCTTIWTCYFSSSTTANIDLNEASVICDLSRLSDDFAAAFYNSPSISSFSSKFLKQLSSFSLLLKSYSRAIAARINTSIESFSFSFFASSISTSYCLTLSLSHFLRYMSSFYCWEVHFSRSSFFIFWSSIIVFSRRCVFSRSLCCSSPDQIRRESISLLSLMHSSFYLVYSYFTSSNCVCSASNCSFARAFFSSNFVISQHFISNLFCRIAFPCCAVWIALSFVSSSDSYRSNYSHRFWFSSWSFCMSYMFNY